MNALAALAEVSFAVPRALWFLLLVPLAILLTVYSEQKRQRDLAKLGDHALIQRLTTSAHTANRHRKQALWVIALAFSVLALARPQWGVQEQVLEQRGLEIMVALDVSESMLAEDIAPNRLTRAKLDISELMRRLDGDALGLVVFSGASFIQFPLTSDDATAQMFLEGASPSLISRPGTVIGDAIRTALTGFSETRLSDRVILLFTDGEDSETNPQAAANDAAEAGVIIHAIGMGTAEGANIPLYDPVGRLLGYKQDNRGQLVLSRLESSSLEALAASTGGRYFDASNPATLSNLITALDSLEQGSLGEQQGDLAIERFQWFLAAALACLLIAEALPERRVQAQRGQAQHGQFQQHPHLVSKQGSKQPRSRQVG